MPSSSMNLLNISSMEDLTAFASERSSRGSRLLMIRLCRRDRTSRCASRAGALGEGKDVFCDLTLTVADDEGDTAVHCQYQCSPVGNDRVRDLAAETRLDI